MTTTDRPVATERANPAAAPQPDAPDDGPGGAAWHAQQGGARRRANSVPPGALRWCSRAAATSPCACAPRGAGAAVTLDGGRRGLHLRPARALAGRTPALAPGRRAAQRRGQMLGGQGHAGLGATVHSSPSCRPSRRTIRPWTRANCAPRWQARSRRGRGRGRTRSAPGSNWCAWRP